MIYITYTHTHNGFQIIKLIIIMLIILYTTYIVVYAYLKQIIMIMGRLNRFQMLINIIIIKFNEYYLGVCINLQLRYCLLRNK